MDEWKMLSQNNPIREYTWNKIGHEAARMADGGLLN